MNLAAERVVEFVPEGRSPAVLEVRNLSVSYGKRQAVSGVELDVYPGEIIAVLGHNGAGKTSLLRGVLGTVRQRSGIVRYQGQNISNVPYFKNVAAGISHMPAELPVFSPLDVETNLRLGAFTQTKKDIAERIPQIWRIFPRLLDRRRQPAGTLSGGERRMLAIGMALMNRPRLILLDEPTVGLAPATAYQILSQVAQLCVETGMAVLLVDQNVRAALRIASRVYYLRMGRVLLSESAEAARNRDHYWDLF
jgi:branched-chain amino acid transport system ATP-binding protein